jgi:hypothetical protein
MQSNSYKFEYGDFLALRNERKKTFYELLHVMDCPFGKNLFQGSGFKESISIYGLNNLPDRKSYSIEYCILHDGYGLAETRAIRVTDKNVDEGVFRNKLKLMNDILVGVFSADERNVPGSTRLGHCVGRELFNVMVEFFFDIWEKKDELFDEGLEVR